MYFCGVVECLAVGLEVSASRVVVNIDMFVLWSGGESLDVRLVESESFTDTAKVKGLIVVII